MTCVDDNADFEIASQGDFDIINEALDIDNLVAISQNLTNSESQHVNPLEKKFMDNLVLFRDEYRKEYLEFKKKFPSKRENEFNLSYIFLRDLATFVNDNCFLWHVSLNLINFRRMKTAAKLC
jgi:exonuclease III